LKNKLIEILRKIFDEQGDIFLFAYLFGSRAREPFSETSDIDIAVYLNSNVQKHYFDIKTELYLKLSRVLKKNDIDIVIMNGFKNIVFLNEIITNGQVFHDKNEAARIDYEQKILHGAIDFKSQRKRAMGV
jgi:predicted nucleotidyltransferase